MICTGDNPAHNQTMYKDVYKYIFYQGCLNGLMIITGHTQHSNKLNVDFGRKLEFIFRRITNSGSVYYDHGFYQGSFEVQTVKPLDISAIDIIPPTPLGKTATPLTADELWTIQTLAKYFLGAPSSLKDCWLKPYHSFGPNII